MQDALYPESAAAVLAMRGAVAPAQLALEHVSQLFDAPKGRPGVQALIDVDLEIRPGEFFTVIGPSGCGKSTLLDVVAGLRVPSSGRVMFEGRPVGGRVPPGVGIVFQEDGSFPWLTVRDNIAFGLKHAGTAPAEIEAAVSQALVTCGLQGFGSAYPSQLSGGMRQRVCLARVLVMRPRLILLDEPFAALDAQTRLLMGDELLRIWRETGATILLITHALDEAALLSNRIAVMSARPGRILEVIETQNPSDRDSSMAADPRFGELTTRLWHTLREQSQVAMEQAR